MRLPYHKSWRVLGIMLMCCLMSPGMLFAQDNTTTDPAKEDGGHDAAQRGLQFLAAEVQQWSVVNKCFSCHNNGDGARVLFLAAKSGRSYPTASTATTLTWLGKPDQWHTNGPNEPFNDLKLARIQFFHALGEAVRAKLVSDPQVLDQAADLVVADQLPSGAWDFPGADELGSPVTYGRALVTASVVRTLRLSNADRFHKNLEKANQWLRSAQPKSVLDAAAVCWGLGSAQDSAAVAQRQHCLSIIRRSESRRGGFGPFADTAPEPFDTAIVLCALSEAGDPSFNDCVQRSREYLRGAQLRDGSWPETTRPALLESYAQRISTTAWAVTALIATKGN